LGGGYGYSSRTHGLASDALVEAAIVLANGTLATASATQNPDIFWALRGAGASYGIVTSMKFQTFAAPSQNIIYSYNINAGSAANMKSVFAALQDYANSTAMPTEMNMRLFIQPQGVR
jgi:FAD/FMN-containing dehydrogenase